MTTVEIKNLYDAANVAYKAAQDLLALGDKITPEQTAQVDQYLDEVDQKTADAKRLERAGEIGRMLTDPTNRPPTAQQKDAPAKVEWNGRVLEVDEVEELKAASPFPGFVSSFGTPYTKSMRAYYRRDASRLSGDELKALSVGEAPAGGYLQQDTFVNNLLVKAMEVSAMRRICNVLPPLPSGAVIIPSEDNIMSDAEWTTELGTGSNDTVSPFGNRRLTPHPFAKRVLVSNTLFRTPTMDIESYVRNRLALKFGATEENAFINGTGVGQPLGLLNTGNLPVHTTATANQVYGDDVITWIYKLPAAYAARATILSNRAFIRKVRTMTKANTSTTFSNYVWQPGLQPGTPNRIMDVPYEVSDRFDDGIDANDAFENNAVVAVIGDFSYYWIVDALNLAVQRLVEKYAETNQTAFIGRKESDGGAVLAEAFYALKVKSA